MAQRVSTTPLKGSRDALANGALKVIRAKRVEVPHGDYTFPLADEEPSKPPRLDDQDCFADDAGPGNDDDDDGPPGDDAPGKDEGSDPSGDQPGPPSGEADEDDKAVKEPKPGERPTVDGMTFGDLFGGSDSEEDEGPVPSSGSRDRPPAEPKAKSKPKPTQAGRRKALNPRYSTHSGSQMADQFLGVTTGMEYVLFGIKRDQRDPQTLRLNFGTTIRSNSAKMTLLGGTALLNSMRDVCAGNEGMRLRLCQ